MPVRYAAHRSRAAVSKQMVLTVALILFITGSLAYTWSKLFGGPATPSRVVEMHFQCALCGDEQEITNEVFQQRPLHLDVLQADRTRTNDNIDCVKCGQKHAAMLMNKCLSCEKYFLPSKVNLRVLPAGEVPPDPICPHCGTNQNQYRREHLSKD